jgi:hypothetical protein
LSTLLVGGYAVGLHGYPRATVDIDILTSIDGVEFDGCAARAERFDLDGLTVPVIGLADLKANKRASGRHKDLADLEYLP